MKPLQFATGPKRSWRRTGPVSCLSGLLILLGGACGNGDETPAGSPGTVPPGLAGANGSGSGGQSGSGGRASTGIVTSPGSGGVTAAVGSGGSMYGGGGASTSIGSGGRNGGSGSGGAVVPGGSGGGARGGSSAGSSGGGGASGLGGGASAPVTQVEPPPVTPCATNMASMCTGTTEIACHFGGNPGNYEVTVELGGATAGTTLVEAEAWRRMLPSTTTTAGQTRSFSFVTNVRVYENEPFRPDQDSSFGKGIAGLDVYFRGTMPRMTSICYKPAAQPVMIWLAGDSTVTDQEKRPFAGWGQHLPQHFVSPISVANYADSGENAASVLGNAKLWGAIKGGMKPGDWVMIQVGHNDKSTSASSFQTSLTRMLTETKAAGGNAVLVTPISRAGGALASQHVNEVNANLPQIIRDLGKSQNVPVIDLTVLTWNWLQTVSYAQYFAGDSTHTNPAGADIVSGLVRDAVKLQIPGLAKFLRVQ